MAGTFRSTAISHWLAAGSLDGSVKVWNAKEVI